MVKVVTVDLTNFGLKLPSDKVGMVLAQPYPTLTGVEPYTCVPGDLKSQLDMLGETLTVARAAHHGAARTHFTIFPEYSIPGLKGIELVEQTLAAKEWPSETVIIGGTDALSKTEFAGLLKDSYNHVDEEKNSSELVRDTEWVNCGIVWIKKSDGNIERWLQPKLAPSWLEGNVDYQDMFRGQSVFTFRGQLQNGTLYRFTMLICFDWIATVNELKAWQWSIRELQQQAIVANAEISLSWFFVIQRNPKPSDRTFLAEIPAFFDRTFLPQAPRGRACLIFANTAGKRTPGSVEQYGGTSLIFSRDAGFVKPDSRPTFSMGGVTFRGSNMLDDYHDYYLREGGACVHSFALLNPGSLVPGPAGRKFALDGASVFPLYGATDPRVPSQGVPSSVKWINDELDDISSITIFHEDIELAAQVEAAHQAVVSALRVLPGQDVAYDIKLAAGESSEGNPDEWGHCQRDALQHLVYTLEILGVGFLVIPGGARPAHATLMINEKPIDVLAIDGKSHEACFETAKLHLPTLRRQTMLISRDKFNTSRKKRFSSFLLPKQSPLGSETIITEPDDRILQVGYYELLDALLNAQSVDGLQEKVNDAFNA